MYVHMCPCSTTIGSRTDMVGECEIYKEERDVLDGEIRKNDERDMQEFGRLNQ